MTTLNSTDIYGSLTTLGNETINGTLINNGELYGINEYIFHGYSECAKHWEWYNLTTPPTANSTTNDSWYITSAGGDWTPGLLSKKRFRRCEGLTFEFEIYCAGSYYLMLGFVDGNSTSFTYSQSPSNLIYFHTNQHTYTYENGAQCLDSAVAYQQPNNVYKKFRIVTNNTGVTYYVFDGGQYNVIYKSLLNSGKYLRILINNGSGTNYFTNMRVFQQNSTPNGDRGVYGGGSIYTGTSYIQTIQYITISAPSNTTSMGNLITGRSNLYSTSNGSFGTGIFGGGCDATWPASLSSLEYIQIMGSGYAYSFGSLSVARQAGGGTSNTTNNRGVFCGGYVNWVPTTYNTIDYITISTTGNATDFGDLTVVKQACGSNSNGTNNRGITGGGVYYSGGLIYISSIDYITISTPGNATSFGNMTIARSNYTSTSNTINDRCVFVGGSDAGTPPYNTIDYNTISSSGNSTDFGDLTVARWYSSGTSNGINNRGVFAGGANSTTWFNTIDYITISSVGNAVDFGDTITLNLGQATACSNSN